MFDEFTFPEKSNWENFLLDHVRNIKTDSVLSSMAIKYD